MAYADLQSMVTFVGQLVLLGRNPWSRGYDRGCLPPPSNALAGWLIRYLRRHAQTKNVWAQNTALWFINGDWMTLFCLFILMCLSRVTSVVRLLASIISLICARWAHLWHRTLTRRTATLPNGDNRITGFLYVMLHPEKTYVKSRRTHLQMRWLRYLMNWASELLVN